LLDVFKNRYNCRLSDLVVFSCEHLDAHDGEDEPEDEAHEQHVEDGRDGLDQGVHHDLIKGHDEAMNLDERGRGQEELESKLELELKFKLKWSIGVDL
jgi:hypothetical protein